MDGRKVDSDGRRDNSFGINFNMLGRSMCRMKAEA